MNDFLTIAISAAQAAGELLRARFGAEAVGVDTKTTTTDMVSDADRAAEELIVAVVRAARPDDAILGEESGASEGGSGFRWVIDPLDGTTNFLFGVPHWAVSIAVEDGAGVVAAVVFDACRNELFTAERGAGARLNGEPLAVRRTPSLAQALCATGFSYRPDERVVASRALVDLIGVVRDIRRAGAAALDLAWVAAGRLDAYFENPIEWWDTAAGSLLVTEAGGRWAHTPGIDGAHGLVAASEQIFDDLLAAVGRAITSAG